MLKVGLTGGIGSGKSTASEILKSKNYKIIDADEISREIYKNSSELLPKVWRAFGDEVFDGEALNRKALGKIIFADVTKRLQLEAIVMPSIIEEIMSRLQQYELQNEILVFVDAATLIEQGLHKFMDKNILIWIDEIEQLNRVMLRDDLSKEEVAQRIKAQMPISDKKKYVDYIIDNNGSISDMKHQIDELCIYLLAEERSKR